MTYAIYQTYAPYLCITQTRGLAMGPEVQLKRMLLPVPKFNKHTLSHAAIIYIRASITLGNKYAYLYLF